MIRNFRTAFLDVLRGGEQGDEPVSGNGSLLTADRNINCKEVAGMCYEHFDYENYGSE